MESARHRRFRTWRRLRPPTCRGPGHRGRSSKCSTTERRTRSRRKQTCSPSPAASSRCWATSSTASCSTASSATTYSIPVTSGRTFLGNVPTRGVGFTEGELLSKSPCGRRMRGQWRYSDWTKSDAVAVSDGSGGYIVDPRDVELRPRVHPHLDGLRVVPPEWRAGAAFGRSALVGDCTPPELSSAAGPSWAGISTDGTFSPVRVPPGGELGHSWLDLYLASLATPDEVPDTHPAERSADGP